MIERSTCWLAFAAVLAAGAGCGGSDSGTPSECNPLGGAGCVTPWPSSIYLIDDVSTATGVRLDIAEGAFPANIDGIEMDPAPYNTRDGFSPAGSIFTVFPEGVDDSNLVGYDDYPASVTDASPTVIINMSTGERVPHFAELDANAGDDHAQQALYLRPAARLEGSTRYAVGIRTSLKAAGGGDLTMPEGFEKIVSGEPSGHERLERVRPGYVDIFAAFENQGIATSDLVVAWDFVTGSDDALVHDLLSARDTALASMGTLASNMTYTIDDDQPYGDGTQIMRRVLGTFQAPMFLTSDNYRTSALARDDNGDPMIMGTMDAELVVMVPACAAAQRPVPMLIFGHGFFGGIDETQGSYVRRVAEELCVVVLGTVWKGMGAGDIAGAALALNDMNNAPMFGERIVQGMVNHFTLEQMARGAIASDMLTDNDGPWVDATKVYFYGISQGHILGATFVAADPFIERAVLHVGGGGWSVLMERSTHWNEYGLILGGAYPNPLDTVIMQAILQMNFDYTENIHYAHRVFSETNPVPGTPDKQLLLQMAVGDSQVTNLATEYQVRTMGIPAIGPLVKPLYGIEEVFTDQPSALVMWDEHPTPLPHESNLLNEVDNGTHGTLRWRTNVVEQIRTFFETGVVTHSCGTDRACDCDDNNACGDPLE